MLSIRVKEDILLLSRSRILRSALAIVDREGPGALTIRRLAAAIGQPPMNLYFWFPSKAALVDQMVDTAFASIPNQLGRLQGPWKRKLRGAFTILRSALVAHPGAIPFLHTRTGAGPHARRSQQILLEIVQSGGLSELPAVRIREALTAYTFGFAFLETGAANGGRRRQSSDRAFRFGLDPLIPGWPGVTRAGALPPHPPVRRPRPRRVPSRLGGPGR
jgi:AcrR family transcriptional regulator